MDAFAAKAEALNPGRRVFLAPERPPGGLAWSRGPIVCSDPGHRHFVIRSMECCHSVRGPGGQWYWLVAETDVHGEIVEVAA